MGYALGIDLGTTQTAAAVHRDGHTVIVTLGQRAATIPSAVHVAADGAILVGDAALRRGSAEPTRLAREFKRRMGDPEPLLLGGIPWAPSAITARLLAAVYEIVCDREGGIPDQVAITHPANWGPYKTDLLRESAALAGLAEATLLVEPEAAAIHYASLARVPVGATIAVYDLGGGTFDAAVLRKTVDGFDLRGRPAGLERFGGVDIDAAVVGHVRRVLGNVLTDLDPADPSAVAAMARLRDECSAAKEALSADVEVAIPVVLPTAVTEVRLTRPELESLIAPVLTDTVSTLRQALRSAGVEPSDLTALLLVGGASRMPLVAKLLTDDLKIPVAVDTHPKHAVALGAALAAAREDAPSQRWPDPIWGAPTTLEPAQAEVNPDPVAHSEPFPRPRRTRQLVGPAVIALLCAVGVGAWWLLRSDGDQAADASAAAQVVPGTAAPTSGPAAVTAVTAVTTVPQSPGQASNAAVLDSVERDDIGSLLVRWHIDPAALAETAPSDLRLHLFYDTQHPESVGTNARDFGRDPGIYYVVVDPAVVANVPSHLGTDDDAATRLCALVADADERILDPTTPTCVQLPAQ